MSHTPRPITIEKFYEVLNLIKKGKPASISIAKLKMSEQTFWRLLKTDEKYLLDYRAAQADALEDIVAKLSDTTKSQSGLMFIAARGYPHFFNKNKEEEITLSISDETRAIMQDKDATGADKMQAINKDLFDDIISMPLAERLASLVKLAHPEMSKTEVSGNIEISEALTPSR